MSKYRQMRVILMYDLPMEEPESLKQYTRFRKKLLMLGFYMLQYSIYVKVVKTRLILKLWKEEYMMKFQGKVISGFSKLPKSSMKVWFFYKEKVICMKNW